MINLYNFDNEQKKIAKKIFKTVMKSQGIKTRQVSSDITMVTNEEIQKVNNETRNIDRVTDVLSFPATNIEFPFSLKDYEHEISPENKTLYIGEIIIATEVMKAQAVEYGHSEARECAFLITHGLLHLLGFDHIDEMDRKVMRAKEDEILAKAKYFR